MFKKHTIEVKMVKQPKEQPTVEKSDDDILDKALLLNYIVKDQVQNAAIFIGSALILLKLTNTAGSIAVVATQAKLHAKMYGGASL